jgi:thiaminase
MKVIETLRRELEPLNREIAEALRPSREALLSFVANQLYIVPHDLKALSAAMAKAKERDEYRFVKTLIDGDFAALGALRELAEELGVEFRWESVDPAAVAYTLTNYGKPRPSGRGFGSLKLLCEVGTWKR